MHNTLPDDFLWGAATSSHQTEGGCTNNNWSAFESAVDASGRPRIAGAQKSGDACQHWNRFEEDICLLKEMGLNAYRFSVEWSKIEPREGVWDDSAMAHYERVVDALCARGIVPMVTLHHFTNPLWFEERGGFLAHDAPDMLARFCRRVYGRLADRVPFWCTLNEPAVFAVNGYVTGEFPPAACDVKKAGMVLGNMLRAHSRIYQECKEVDAGPRIGLAVNMFIFAPARAWHPLDRIAAILAQRNMNEQILRYLVDGELDFHFPFMVRTRITAMPQDAFDFIGLNYYTRFHLRFSMGEAGHVRQVVAAGPMQTTDMGWEIYPDGLRQLLHYIAGRTPKPIIVTENGIADDSDGKRSGFFKDHLRSLLEARKAGVDVRGYFCWTLMDNFEWAHGYSKRFGLYHVDFSTQQRTLRDGSRVLRDFIRRTEPV
jgi:beta-glucosidase